MAIKLETISDASIFSFSGRILEKIEKARETCNEKLGNPVEPTLDLELISEVPDINSLLNKDSVKNACALCDNWTGDLFNVEWSTVRTILIENINRICVKAKEKVDEIINNVPSLVVSKLLNSFFDTTEDFVNTVVAPVDVTIKDVTYKYNDVIRKWRTVQKKTKDVKAGLADESDRKATLKELISEIEQVDENTASILMITFTGYCFIDSVDSVEKLKSTTKGTWNRVINEYKDEYEVLEELHKYFKNNTLIKSLFTLIGILLPIIAALAAALLCSNDADAQIRQTAAKTRDEELASNGINPDDIYGEEEEKKLEEQYSKLSILLEYGLKNIYGYSMEYDDDGNVINSSSDVSSNAASTDIISICQVQDISDSLEKDFNEAGQSKRYVLELGKDLVGGYFTVNKGNKISNNQTIGYYQNIPIKSKVSGTVIDKKAKHIIVESNSDTNSITAECENIVNTLDFTDKYSPIVDKFKKFSNIENFLTDYALPCRIPNVMLHSQKETFLIKLLIGSLKTKAINDYKYKLWDQYTEKSNDAINGYKNKIKNLCSSTNIETSCENRQNDKLKDKIFDTKKQGVKDIINFYNSGIQKLSKASIDVDTTYLLVSDYINYLSDTTFNYDDQNEYVVELFNDINGFIKDRIKAESINKQDLIKEFNSRCKDLLSSKIRTSDYYQYFSRMFTSDWYVQDDDKIIGISSSRMKSDESYDSLYKKMYNYIVNLIGSKDIERDNATIDYENITDPKAFINSKNAGTSSFTKNEEKTIENQNKAKSITKYFMIIKNMSTNYRVNNNVNLKSKTQSEAQILDRLIKKVIAEYNKPENLNFYDNIDKMFNEFKQVNCPYDGTIYINNINHEHFIYSNVTDTQMNPYNMNATDDELMDRLSCKTAYTPFQLPYWLIYCAEATLVNVMVPLYWSTGIIIAGVPIILPIIYIPIYFLAGSVSVLFGLGICGIAIWPMMVFINNTAYNSTVILPVTMAIDFIKRKLRELGNLGINSLTISAKPLIASCDAQLYELEDQLDKVNIQMGQLKNNIAGVDPSKITSVEIPDINMSNILSNKVNAILASVKNDNSSNDEKEIMAEDGLYHNVVVCLDPAGGKPDQENKSPFTDNGTYPSGWEKTKTPNEELMKFNEYKWSLEICNQIKTQLETKGIKVYITNTGNSQPKARCLKAYNHKLTSIKHHIMVSIAVNSADPDDKQWRTGDSGWSIYTANRGENITYYQDSVDLAECIYDNAITKFVNKDMNLKTNLGENWIGKKNDYYKQYKIRHSEADYTIVVNAPEQNNNLQSMPTVLSKNFYCDNIDDLKYLNSAAGKADIATVHVNGILNFISSKGWA